MDHPWILPSVTWIYASMTMDHAGFTDKLPEWSIGGSVLDGWITVNNGGLWINL